MKKEYFIIRSGEDGISIDGPLSWEEAAGRLVDRYYGEVDGFFDKVPEQDKGTFWRAAFDNGLLIIKGEIVVPKPKKVVETFEEPR